MCYAKDYKVFDDQKKAEDTRVVQERRTGLIDRLLNAAPLQRRFLLGLKLAAGSTSLRVDNVDDVVRDGGRVRVGMYMRDGLDAVELGTMLRRPGIPNSRSTPPCRN